MSIGLVVLLCSCISSKEVKDEYVSLVPVDSLCSVVGIPTTMKLFDDKLFLVDMFNGESLISVYDIKTKAKVFSFGEKGNGPEEFLQITSLDFSDKGNGQIEMLAFDPVRKQCSIYNYQHLLNGNRNKEKSLNIAASVPYLYELYKLNKGYIATGRLEKDKYVLFSDSLEVSDYKGEYRPKPMKGIPDVLHSLANYGKTEFSLDKKKMVEIVYNASVLSMYDVNLDNIAKRWEYVIDELDYKVIDGSINKKSVMGYLSAYVGDRYVYALYSGKPENLDEIATYGDEIHVLDYDGKMVERIKIERPAFSLAVDESENKIFTLCHIPETMVFVYDYER